MDGGDASLSGGNDADSLVGGTGNDTLDGGAGIDTLAGGGGNDRYLLTAGDIVIEGAGGGTDTALVTQALYTLAANLEVVVALGGAARRFTGNGLDNTITGAGLADTLFGGIGNDLLDGGTGADSLLGGIGSDIMVVDNAGDVVVEAANQGIDTVRTTLAAYTLGANVENLVALNGIAHLFTGNTLANAMTGSIGADTLLGGAGNDTLNGGGGIDSMLGGADNDTYVVDTIGDVVVEAANQGIDTVRTGLAAYTLALNVETLVGTATTGQALTGNVLGNAITGGIGADTLAGGFGNDTLTGGAGIDRLLGGTNDDTYIVDTIGDVVIEAAAQGTDTVRTTLAAYTLGLNVENLVALNGIAHAFVGNALANAITGGIGADTLSGGIGADTLNGAAGIDRLVGGTEGDTYFVTIGDVVVELAGQGQDTVIATEGTSVTLAANTEVLVMQGAALVTGVGTALGDTLLGNALGNVLFGQAGADSLAGGAGGDVLLGGAGADTLTGGTQADRFRFDAVAESTPLAADRITDFVFAAGDRIVLSLIDANSFAPADQAFAFIGAAAFGGTGAASAGQLRVTLAAPGQWRAQGDVNGDGVADLQIDIVSASAPVAGWFIL